MEKVLKRNLRIFNVSRGYVFNGDSNGSGTVRLKEAEYNMKEQLWELRADDTKEGIMIVNQYSQLAITASQQGDEGLNHDLVMHPKEAGVHQMFYLIRNTVPPFYKFDPNWYWIQNVHSGHQIVGAANGTGHPGLRAQSVTAERSRVFVFYELDDVNPAAG